MPFGDIRQTASVAEVAWTTIGLVALVVNLGLTWNAARDYRALTSLGRNGGRKIAAQTALTIQAGLTAPQVVAVAIGVLAMLNPPANPDKPVPLVALILTLGLILNEAILVWVGLYTHFRRVKLLGYLDRQEQTAGEARHVESMAELTHNTQISTEARDGALDAFHTADNMNLKLLKVQQEIAEINQAAGRSADALRELLEEQENGRATRQDAREVRQDARDAQQDKRDERKEREE